MYIHTHKYVCALFMCIYAYVLFMCISACVLTDACWYIHITHKPIWINKSSVNPKSTSAQSSKPCRVLLYPSRQGSRLMHADTYTCTHMTNALFMCMRVWCVGTWVVCPEVCVHIHTWVMCTHTHTHMSYVYTYTHESCVHIHIPTWVMCTHTHTHMSYVSWLMHADTYTCTHMTHAHRYTQMHTHDSCTHITDAHV